MFSNRKTIALVVGGWALLSAFGRMRKQARKNEKKLRKTEMTTWENEGGNLPPSQTLTHPAKIPAAS